MTKAELRTAIDRHLREHPDAVLTAYEIARALGLAPQPGQVRVRKALGAMEAAGEVCCDTSRRDGDGRQVLRWLTA